MQVGGGQRERETQNPTLTVWSSMRGPMWGLMGGLNSPTVRS